MKLPKIIMINKKIVEALLIAFVINVGLNFFWPTAILQNLLFDAVYKFVLTLPQQYIFLFIFCKTSLLILEYVIIFVAVLMILGRQESQEIARQATSQGD